MELKQSGKRGTLVVAAIIFVISALSNFSKELFVEQSGKFEIFGNFGFLLVIGLLWRWRHIGNIVSILTMLSILTILMSLIMAKSISIAFFILLLGLSIAFYLTTFYKPVNIYLNKIEGYPPTTMH
ncbi:MAG: hypothetical protein IPN73_16760 [Saprospiraceae bacterium]|nr:hypothetical protein [Saprospiraceae bacterium]